ASCASAKGAPAYGLSHVSVSRMYSTCVSECFVPDMNVTAESTGQSPYRPTTSSAPRPFWTVITAAFDQRPARADAASSRPVAFVATITRSGPARSDGEAPAATDGTK